MTGAKTGLRRALAVLIAGSGCILVACEVVEPSAVAFGLEEIEPRSGWHEAYEETESCLEAAGDFERVQWFQADSMVSIQDGTPLVASMWLVAQGFPHGIAFRRTALDNWERNPGEFRDNELAAVKHESIHEILQLGSHDGEFWCRCDPHPGPWLTCNTDEP